ncbi:jg7542 [Pararge aegeria aegeria]|uniref:Cytosolic beta-glucosidase n=1 Tax=Pararge aegeria aegeria TaxID=348720 RepID=A0A8S4S7S6_9NEOP|nr:jg7542 [Pararge aegeria aegeria]
MRKLPQGLKLGVATAAYQIEGAWNFADKTPNIWDTLCHNNPESISDGTNADDACKSFEFYKRDIDMLKFVGVDFYRFSISWPRLLPNGFANKISEIGYEYYNNFINELLANNIEPVITMYHWDLPQNLQDLGGWANPLIADWFGDYARVLYKLFGDRVKMWVTINEPKQIGLMGYGMTRMAPALNATGIGEYLTAKNIVMAHARSWHIYNEEFRDTQKGVCGITIATDFREGVTDSPEDLEAGLDAIEFEVGLYSHPIFSSKGGFPERVIKRVGARSAEQGYPNSRLPEFTPEEIEYVKGTSDFYGFNHYSSKFYTRSAYKPGTYAIPSYDDDIGADFTYLDYEKGAVPHVTVIPHGIRKALTWVKDNCNNPPIFITENGFGTFGGLKDATRISYYRRYLDSILDAIEQDGCNVVSYTAWSLIDNFEWSSGLSIKFGLFEVDFDDENRKRTARASALWYKKLISTRMLDSNDDDIPELVEHIF